MNTFTEITIANLEKRIKSHQPNAEMAFQRLVAEGKMSKDFITPVGTNNDRRNAVINFTANGKVKMEIQIAGEVEEYSIHSNAVRQLGEKMNVPAKYLEQLARGGQWERDLCANILNEHIGYTKRSKVLVRSVGGEVRGFLSDQYRRLHSEKLVQDFVKAGYEHGSVMADGLMTDTKFFLEMLMPQPLVFDTPRNGQVVMSYGARLATSDYGDGALELRTFTMQGVCLNGMVRESVLRTIHLGAKLPDNLRLSEETYKHDTNLQASLLKDLTAQIFKSEMIQKEMEIIQDASYMEVDMEKEIKLLAKTGLIKTEVEKVGKVLMDGKTENGVSGEPSLWKLVNGVTAVGRDADPARGREIQEIAGKLMNRVSLLKKS